MGRKPKEHLIGELVVAEGEVSRLRGFKEELTKQLVAAEDRNRELTRRTEALQAELELAEKGRLIVTREFVRLLDYIEEMDARESRSNPNAMWIDARSFYGLKCEATTCRSNAFEQQLNNALTAPPSSAPSDDRADTKEERRIENELFAGDLYSGIKP